MNRREFLHLTGATVVAAGAVGSSPAPAHSPSKGVYRWGLDSLDAHTFFRPGELCLVFGPPCSGKTTLLMHAARQNIRDRGTNVFYEDPYHELFCPSEFFSRAELDHFHLTNDWCYFAQHSNLAKNAVNGLIVLDPLTWAMPCPANPRQGLLNLRQMAEQCHCGVIVSIGSVRGSVFNECHPAEEEIIAWSPLKDCDLVIECLRDGTPDKPAVGLRIVKNRYGPYPYGPQKTYSHPVVGRLALGPAER